MENTDAKVLLMIDDLSRGALCDLLGDEFGPDNSHSYLIHIARERYEAGDISAEEVTAAWNDDTWNGKE